MKKTIKKVLVLVLMNGLMLILTASAGFAWNAATHAYIEENLNKKTGKSTPDILNNRIYGANALDLFNDNFYLPYLAFADYFHSTSEEYFLKAWQIASNKDEKAFAYGFVSHNNKWGMDSTAHISGKTYGKDTGYVIAKAQALAAILRPYLPEEMSAIDEETLVNLCHYLVESGVDFLVREKDPLIGSKLMNAAYARSESVPTLLANAYKADFAYIAIISENEAANTIIEAEENFQASMIGYGWVLAQDDALDYVAAGLADVGLSYLELPEVYRLMLEGVAMQGILAAMELCRSDFERELKADTGWGNGKLSSAGVTW
jgi:hypothetical protein